MEKRTHDHLKPTHDEFFRFLTESPAVRKDLGLEAESTWCTAQVRQAGRNFSRSENALVGVCFPDLAPELGALTVVPGEFSSGKRADLLLSAVD